MKNMTDEELATSREVLGADVPPPVRGMHVAAVWSHIAALTAERDDMQSAAHAAVSALLALVSLLTNDEAEPAMDAARRVVAERDALRERVRALEASINTPETEDFIRALPLEASHQQGRWGAEHDLGKTDADWFWLLGYLGGKALRPNIMPEKRRHHIISLAAACLNWHRHTLGVGGMRPGIAPPSEMDGLEGEMADTSGLESTDYRAPPARDVLESPSPAEPTTAEAFAAVREALEHGSPDHSWREDALLRLAAIERKVAVLVRACASIATNSDEPSTRAVAQAAITDAPEVYTLEEVERVLTPITVPSHPDVCDDIKAAVLEGLDAIRR